MGKKEEIKSTHNIVEEILIKSKKARNSDDYLYVQVVKKINPQAVSMPFINVMHHVRDLGLPSYETVSRTRRKLQEDHPELWSDKTIKIYREAAEKDFEDYARS